MTDPKMPPNVKVKPLPNLERLQELLCYNPETGAIYRKPRSTLSAGVSQRYVDHWNSRYAGKSAFTSADKRGYLHGKVDGINYQAHRIVWKLHYGYDPVCIDHINGVQGDNRIANLRNCTVAENSRNYAKRISGSSSYRGVVWVSRDRKFAANISFGGRRISLGHFDDEIEAAKSYDRAAVKYHGEFATLNFPALTKGSTND